MASEHRRRRASSDALGGNAARAASITVRRRPDDIYDAYVGTDKAGWAQIDIARPGDPPGIRRIFRVAVKQGFRRMGVATRLYDIIEKDLVEAELSLVPAKPRQLSDEAFGFWMRRDPDRLRDDPRHPEYVGSGPLEP